MLQVTLGRAAVHAGVALAQTRPPTWGCFLTLPTQNWGYSAYTWGYSA